jgi:hypothetical protein
VERVEAAQVVGNLVAALVRLGDHHHQRVRQRAAREHEQLEHVVERGGVGAAGPDHRQHLLEVVAEELGRSCDSRARIQLTLPRSVLISPLCAIRRYGWASSQLGNVLVE